jgi:hypothetical protein
MVGPGEEGRKEGREGRGREGGKGKRQIWWDLGRRGEEKEECRGFVVCFLQRVSRGLLQSDWWVQAIGMRDVWKC